MIYKNKKKGTLYKLKGTVINCTNAQDGQVMLVYEPLDNEDNLVFVRERNEFYEKFELVENKCQADCDGAICPHYKECRSV